MTHPVLYKILVIFALAVPGARGFAQTGEQPVEPALSKYNNTVNFPKEPKVEFKNLGTRRVLSSPEMKFVADEDVTIEYDVTVSPEGKVVYVRPRYCRPEYNEYRKGGINFLYASKFNSVSTETGDLRITVIFTFPGVEFPTAEEQVEKTEEN